MAALREAAPQRQPQHGAALSAAHGLPGAKLSRDPGGGTSRPHLYSREISAEGGRGGRRRKEEPPPPLPRAGAGDGVGRGSRALTPRSGMCGVFPFPQPLARAWPLRCPRICQPGRPRLPLGSPGRAPPQPRGACALQRGWGFPGSRGSCRIPRTLAPFLRNEHSTAVFLFCLLGKALPAICERFLAMFH